MRTEVIEAYRALVLAIFAAGSLCACADGVRTTVVEDVTLRGVVDLTAFSPARHAQAALGEVADRATVSLMESQGTASVTVGTAVTTAGGGFNMTFRGFQPTSGQAYVLEAFKGLEANAVNRDAVRLRTLIHWLNGGWVTLTNSMPGSVNIGIGTTAVSAMYGLRPNGMPALSLMGTVTNLPEALPLPATDETFTPPATPSGAMTQADFHVVYDLVKRAVLGNSDPITAVQYGDDGYFVKTNLDPFIDNLSSVAAGYGAPLVITGYRFDSIPTENQVFFGGATGSVATIDLTRPNSPNILYVTVPEGAPSGEVMVRNAYGLSNGIVFKVTPRIGGQISN